MCIFDIFLALEVPIESEGWYFDISFHVYIISLGPLSVSMYEIVVLTCA